MTKLRSIVLCVSLLGVAASLANCTDYIAEDCDHLRTCAGSAGNGTSGNGGSAGNGTSGTNSGGASNAGSSFGGAAGASAAAAGEAGAAGSGPAPCDDSCSASTPVCKMSSNTCVECTATTDCKDPTKPACDTATNTCVECTAVTDCTAAAKPFCDTTAETCVACLKQGDCTAATASACSAGQCKPCTMDAECSNIAGKGVCDAGSCVQCTGAKFTACGQNAGTPLVCDSLQHTCTSNKEHSSGLCQACVTDAQCNAGQVCVLDKFGTPSKDVGYFCHWKKGDMTDGAPADCFATGQPYSGTQVNAISVDGVTSDICVLASSTCIALNQFKTKDCSVASAPSDAACGVSPPKDAKCAQIPSSTSYRCTMTCGANEDCPSPFTCNKGVSPFVCTFN